MVNDEDPGLPEVLPEMANHEALVALAVISDPALRYVEKMEMIDRLFPPALLARYPMLVTTRDTLVLGAHMLGQAQEQQAALSQMAFHDPLTGLLNRRSADLECGRKTQGPRIVLYADIDHFKNINDTYGHEVGDLVLKEVARRLSVAMRPGDLAFRHGGEEFLALVLYTGTAYEIDHFVELVAERLRVIVNKTPIKAQSHNLTVSISVGAAVAKSGDDDLNAVIALADAALFRAKEGGRNRVEIAYS